METGTYTIRISSGDDRPPAQKGGGSFLLATSIIGFFAWSFLKHLDNDAVRKAEIATDERDHERALHHHKKAELLRKISELEVEIRNSQLKSAALEKHVESMAQSHADTLDTLERMKNHIISLEELTEILDNNPHFAELAESPAQGEDYRSTTAIIMGLRDWRRTGQNELTHLLRYLVRVVPRPEEGPLQLYAVENDIKSGVTHYRDTQGLGFRVSQVLIVEVFFTLRMIFSNGFELPDAAGPDNSPQVTSSQSSVTHHQV